MALSVSIMTGKYERTSINVCCYLITYAGIFFNPRGVMWLKIENVEWPASDSSCVYLMSFCLVNEFITDQKLKPKEKCADRRWKILSYENSNMTRIKNEKRRTFKISLCAGDGCTQANQPSVLDQLRSRRTRFSLNSFDFILLLRDFEKRIQLCVK